MLLHAEASRRMASDRNVTAGEHEVEPVRYYERHAVGWPHTKYREQ